VYLEPKFETMYYQFARIWDILSVMKAIENVKNRAGEPGKLKGRVDLMEAWRTKTASKPNVRKIVNEMKEALGVRRSDEKEETQFAWTYWLQSNPARDDRAAPKALWKQRHDAMRIPPVGSAMVVAPVPAAPAAPAAPAPAVEDNVFGIRSPLTNITYEVGMVDGKQVFIPGKPPADGELPPAIVRLRAADVREGSPALSEIQVVDAELGLIQLSKQTRVSLEYSMSVLEGQVVANDDGGPPGGRLEAADEDDFNVRGAQEVMKAPPPVPLAQAVEQHALIKDLAPMVVGSYYRDHKGNPYTVIDEYIITDEDLPIFRSVMNQLDGGDEGQVAFIRWRFYLLYADMLRLRYEHLTDLFPPVIDGLARESKWITNISVGPGERVRYMLNRVGDYRLKLPDWVTNPDAYPPDPPPTGYEWEWRTTVGSAGQWNITRGEDPDLEFKIKVLESDARLLDTKIRTDIKTADEWVLKQTDPDLAPTIEEELGIAARRQTPQQLLGAANRRINRARRWIRAQYKRPAVPADRVDVAIGALVTVTAANAPDKDTRDAVEKAVAADAEAARAEEAVAVPPSGGRRRSYRRHLSKLV